MDDMEASFLGFVAQRLRCRDENETRTTGNGSMRGLMG